MVELKQPGRCKLSKNALSNVFDFFDGLDWMRMRLVNKHFKMTVEMTVKRRNKEMQDNLEFWKKEYKDDSKITNALKFCTSIMDRLEEVRDKIKQLKVSDLKKELKNNSDAVANLMLSSITAICGMGIDPIVFIDNPNFVHIMLNLSSVNKINDLTHKKQMQQF